MMGTRIGGPAGLLLRAFMLLCAFCIGVAAGSAWFLAPHLLSREIGERLRASAAARGLALEIDAIYVDPLSSLVLDGVAIRDAEHPDAAPLARIGRLEVAYSVHGITSPRVYLHEIRLRSPRLYLHRDAGGGTNLDGLLARLAGGGGSGGGGAGGLRRYLSSHVPGLTIDDLALALDDDRGAPLITPAGTDARHLRLREASLSIHDESKRREVSRFVIMGSTGVVGFRGRVQIEGTLQWPDRHGWLTVELPEDFAIRARGFAASVARVTVHSEGRIELGGVRIDRLPAGDSPFSLDVRQVRLELTAAPAPLSSVPAALRTRLPDTAVALLRHIGELTVEQPVIVGKRADDRRRRLRRSSGAKTALLPARTRRTDARGRTTGKRTAGKRTAGGQTARRRTTDRRLERHGRDKRTAKQRAMQSRGATKELPGEKVRRALVAMFTQASDRLSGQLGRLRTLAASIPVRRIRVHHGRARYRDERPDAGAGGGVSDFSGTIERTPSGVVAVKVDFGVPGSGPAHNAISGRVQTRTGDSVLAIRLDHLPIAPYAAIMPAAVSPRADSAIKATTLELRYNARDSRVALDGRGRVEHIDFDLPKVSREVIEDLSVSARGKLELDLKTEKVAIDAGRIDIDRFQVLFDGSITHYRSAPRFNIAARVPTIRCQDAVASLVPRFAPTLDGMTCSGTMAFRFSFALDTARMRSLKFEFEPTLRSLKIESPGKYIDFDVLQGPFEHHARQPDGTLYTFVTGPGAERWVPLEEMSEKLIKVVTTTEDALFFVHNGFSLRQIRGAMVANLRKGRFVRGASTISQQTAKNLFFIEREKTISRKLQEAVVTWEMEHRLTKEQIIELYFNIIEFGPRIYGIKAAANHYFRRAPGDLTLLQSIWLGSIIPGPRRFYHQFVRGNSGPSWRSYLCWIGRTMHKREKITAEQLRRLGECNVVFGGGPDGSEEPDPGAEFGLGYEGDANPGIDGPTAAGEDDSEGAKGLRRIRAMRRKRLMAPSVDPEDQP